MVGYYHLRVSVSSALQTKQKILFVILIAMLYTWCISKCKQYRSFGRARNLLQFNFMNNANVRKKSIYIALLDKVRLDMVLQPMIKYMKGCGLED